MGPSIAAVLVLIGNAALALIFGGGLLLLGGRKI